MICVFVLVIYLIVSLRENSIKFFFARVLEHSLAKVYHPLIVRPLALVKVTIQPCPDVSSNPMHMTVGNPAVIKAVKLKAKSVSAEVESLRR
jgi:hypothetical protein